MKRISTLLVTVCLVGLAAPTAAALNVFTCQSEWASLVREIAGDKAAVSSATTAAQDSHRVEARPSLIARMRSADLVVCTGSDLEIGWLPVLLSQAGNARVQPGNPGYLEASQYVARIEIPATIDRSHGDIHPGGNPHIHTDPRNIAKVAEALIERLTQLDAANAPTYRSRGKSFLARWRSAIQRWEQQAAPLRGVPIVVYHKDWSYFIKWLGLREVGSLEPKPGIPPTSAYLAELVGRMQREPAKIIIYAAYNSPKPAQFLAERTRIPEVMLPFTVGGSEAAKDLFGLFDDTMARLLAVVK
ncbi:MAG: zinc ABC transporter substrate-binding protein [Betaproteobacteria bacterium]|nr:zinc ABC transporter substrate-binding protein [Betaproteobacteria bacterium]